jgi:hypothetical protein
MEKLNEKKIGRRVSLICKKYMTTTTMILLGTLRM